MTDETICALATGAGGAIGIIRVSGSRAIAMTDSIFRPTGSRTLSEAAPRTIHHGSITDDDGSTVDDVLVSVFRAPHSYTGEDSTEISCHGSPYILSRTLQLLIKAGCRQAQPGEYTRRAFLNGKMDLSQAEAVADLIASTGRAAHRMAMGQLRGSISTELTRLRDRLLHMTTLLELELDFSDHEELQFADRSELLGLARATDRQIMRLAGTFAAGQAVRQGIPVAIVGQTNVGKSTLLNLLAGDDKAIVSPVHGTTRDVIEATADIGGLTFRLADTAGLRNTSDEIERIGIERTYRKAAEAAIVLWLVDRMPAPDETSAMAALCSGKRLIVVNSKTDLCDLTPRLAALQPDTLPDAVLVGISAMRGTGIDGLREAIRRAAAIPAIQENDVVITSSRHHEALIRAHEAIARVIDGLGTDLGADLVCEDLRICLDHLAEITGGRITTDEVLGNIFGNFCIGK